MRLSNSYFYMESRGEEVKFTGKTYLIEGRNSVDSWIRAIKLISQQQEILAGEDYVGNVRKTKDSTLIIELDEEAVEEILDGKVHPAFSMGKQSLEAYSKEFTYKYVKDSWKLDKNMLFAYTYMDRLINYPVPTIYLSQGRLLEFDIPQRYFTTFDGGYTGGFDQIMYLHDALRKDGISRRHQMILWIPAIDMFSKNPPCLQRIWFRILVPKDKWNLPKYQNSIPVEVGISYRSWDLVNAMPANLYAIVSMLQRYIFGNLTEETEYKNGQLNKYNNVDFKIEKLILFGNAVHIYEDSYNIINKV